jgi:hypothetical protein
VHVFDHALGRRQVFDSNLTLLSASTVGASAVIGALVLGNGSTVLNMAVHSATGVHTLHMMDTDGRIIRSLGLDLRPAIRESQRQNNHFIRRLARASRGGFWVATPYDPIIEEYDASGNSLRRATIASRHFSRRPPEIGQSMLTLGERPAGSTMIGLWESADGSVVIVYLVPRDATFQGSNRWEMFRSVVEIVDPVRGTVIGSKLFEGEAIAVPEPGLVAMYSEEEGQPILVVYRVEISSAE